MNLRDEIKKRRKEIGITQKHFASKVGVSHTHYSNFESGKNNISDSMLESVLNELDLILLVIKKDWINGK